VKKIKQVWGEGRPRWRKGKIINGGAKFFANTFSRLINFGSAVAALRFSAPDSRFSFFVLFYYQPFFNGKVLSLTVLGLYCESIMHTSLNMRKSRLRNGLRHANLAG